MSRTDHHNGTTHACKEGPFRVHGVIHNVASRAKLATLPEREAIAEELDAMVPADPWLVEHERAIESWSAQNTVSHWTSESSGYKLPSTLLAKQPRTDINVRPKVRVQHVHKPAPVRRWQPTGAVGDCWNEQRSTPQSVAIPAPLTLMQMARVRAQVGMTR